MKRFFNKNIIISIIIVIVLAIVVFVILPIISNVPMPISDNENVEISQELSDDIAPDNSTDKSEAEKLGEEVFSIDTSDLYSFTITDASGVEATFERDNDSFVYKEDNSANLDQKELSTCLSYLCNIYADAMADKVELSNPHSFSIQDANDNITIIDIYDGPDKLSYFTLNNDTDNIYINNGTLNYLLELNMSDLF